MLANKTHGLYLLFVCAATICTLSGSTEAGNDSGWAYPLSSCMAGPSEICPVWRVSADVLYLDRSSPDALVLMEDTTDPSRNLDAADFRFDWRPAWQISAATSFAGAVHFEARVMSLRTDNASTTATTNSTLANPLRIATAPSTFAPNVQNINAIYRSQLDSAEANFQFGEGGCSGWLLGFRYVELDERLSALLNAPPQLFSYNVATQNRMFGVQTGFGVQEHWVGNWLLGGYAKFGLFHNSSGQTSTSNAVVASQSANRAAFVGELGISATRCLTDRLSLRLGYNVLWLETVALAGDQIPATNLVTGNGIAPDGGVFFFGGFAGLEYAL